jgi:hypothetical protein
MHFKTLLLPLASLILITPSLAVTCTGTAQAGGCWERPIPGNQGAFIAPIIPFTNVECDCQAA